MKWSVPVQNFFGERHGKQSEHYIFMNYIILLHHLHNVLIFFISSISITIPMLQSFSNMHHNLIRICNLERYRSIPLWINTRCGFLSYLNKLIDYIHSYGRWNWIQCSWNQNMSQIYERIEFSNRSFNRFWRTRDIGNSLDFLVWYLVIIINKTRINGSWRIFSWVQIFIKKDWVSSKRSHHHDTKIMHSINRVGDHLIGHARKNYTIID